MDNTISNLIRLFSLFSVIRKTKESDQEIWCSEQADGDSMKLLTCTFLNPEYALDDFIEIVRLNDESDICNLINTTAGL